MTGHHGRGPVVHQELLIQRLIELRRINGLTQEGVSGSLSWSLAKVRRFEGGQQALPLHMLEELLDLYEVSGTRRGQELRQLGIEARKRSWWSKYRSVMSPSYRRFVGLEAGADRILHLQIAVIPGLLQTREYAQWITEFWEFPSVVDPLLEIRMHRQTATSQRSPRPRQVYLLDENAIRKHVGHPGLMARQLHHLLKLAEQPEIDIHIIPDTSGIHYGLSSGSFILLEFDNGLNGVVCVENRNSCTVKNDPGEFQRHRGGFRRTMTESAMNTQESHSLMQRYATQMQTEQ
ncbi:helix-turn-helix domain-containing protein [Nocardiopsis sp. NPDC006938]|uniref:helix-turn-helix domain-containing protein n=1 Tax=Nocardiopsis sp. NPDC006938 TaxID=3364337 RepID=UPI00368792BA